MVFAYISIFRLCPPYRNMTSPYEPKKPSTSGATAESFANRDFIWISQYQTQNQNLSAVARFLAFLWPIQNRQCHFIFVKKKLSGVAAPAPPLSGGAPAPPQPPWAVRPRWAVRPLIYIFFYIYIYIYSAFFNGCTRPSGPTSSCANHSECNEFAYHPFSFQYNMNVAIKRKGPDPHGQCEGPEAPYSCSNVQPIAMRVLEKLPALRRRIGRLAQS